MDPIVSSLLPLVLFDFNGVIADDEPVHQMLLQKVVAEEGITVTDAEYHEVYLGFDDKGCFEEAFRRAERELADESLGDLIARKSAYYDAYIDEHLVLFPGAVECIRGFVSESYHLGVVSGALRGEIGHILEVAGVDDAFGLMVAAEDTAQCKPHPEGYLKALAVYNLFLAEFGQRMEPTDCVVIEDSIAGVRSAKAAGMHCVAVTHSYRADELAEADRVIESMAEFTPELARELTG